VKERQPELQAIVTTMDSHAEWEVHELYETFWLGFPIELLFGIA